MKDASDVRDEMSAVFAEWNKSTRFLPHRITANILAFKDTDGQPLVDKILDAAGQKGTGKWTVISSQDLGIPITLISEAVYARCVSALKDERVVAAKKLKGPSPKSLQIERNSSRISASRYTGPRSSLTPRGTC